MYLQNASFGLSLHSFFGLFGIYYSLVYLSLSDATVLTFLAPLCTTVAGSVFLGEKFSYREILAGCKSFSSMSGWTYFHK
jgi:drug/metabolite transporter (DMT)-like permease